MADAFLITCEHGGNTIPLAYQGLFQAQDNLLNSHYGYDVGALAMAQSLAATLNAPLLASTTSRLLIDLNRPLGHPHLFSAISRDCSPEVRAEIVGGYHRPYWEKLKGIVSRSVAAISTS